MGSWYRIQGTIRVTDPIAPVNSIYDSFMQVTDASEPTKNYMLGTAYSNMLSIPSTRWSSMDPVSVTGNFIPASTTKLVNIHLRVQNFKSAKFKIDIHLESKPRVG